MKASTVAFLLMQLLAPVVIGAPLRMCHPPNGGAMLTQIFSC